MRGGLPKYNYTLRWGESTSRNCREEEGLETRRLPGGGGGLLQEHRGARARVYQGWAAVGFHSGRVQERGGAHGTPAIGSFPHLPLHSTTLYTAWHIHARCWLPCGPHVRMGPHFAGRSASLRSSRAGRASPIASAYVPRCPVRSPVCCHYGSTHRALPPIRKSSLTGRRIDSPHSPTLQRR